MFNQIMEIQERFRLELLAKQGVVGVAVGYRNYQGESTDDVTLIALVEKKRPLSEIADDDLVPRDLDGARTDVVEVGQLWAHSLGSRSRWRPIIPAGVSIGHAMVTAGTLGAVVRDNDTGQALLLSNNHVMANSNDTNLGDAILQPGRIDLGTNPADKVATLTRYSRLLYTDENATEQPIIEIPRITPDPTPPSTPISNPPVSTPTSPLPFDPTPEPSPVESPPNDPTPPTQPAPIESPAEPPKDVSDPIQQPVTEAKGCATVLMRLGSSLARSNRKNEPDESTPDTTSAQATANAQNTGTMTPLVDRVSAQRTIPTNTLDVALATPLNPAIFSNEIRHIGRIDGTVSPQLGMRVRKTGRTTDYTEGTITLLNATVDVNYNTVQGVRTARFVGQVMTTGMSQGGDSGSLIVDAQSQRAVGLLFAGSSIATIFTPIDIVMRSMRFHF